MARSEAQSEQGKGKAKGKGKRKATTSAPRAPGPVAAIVEKAITPDGAKNPVRAQPEDHEGERDRAIREKDQEIERLRRQLAGTPQAEQTNEQVRPSVPAPARETVPPGQRGPTTLPAHVAPTAGQDAVAPPARLAPPAPTGLAGHTAPLVPPATPALITPTSAPLPSTSRAASGRETEPALATSGPPADALSVPPASKTAVTHLPPGPPPIPSLASDVSATRMGPASGQPHGHQQHAPATQGIHEHGPAGIEPQDFGIEMDDMQAFVDSDHARTTDVLPDAYGGSTRGGKHHREQSPAAKRKRSKRVVVGSEDEESNTDGDAGENRDHRAPSRPQRNIPDQRRGLAASRPRLSEDDARLATGMRSRKVKADEKGKGRAQR